MKISACRPEGNAYAVMGHVESLLRSTGRRDEIPAIMERMKSGDYRHLCRVAEEVSFGTIMVVFDDDEMEE